MNVAAPIRLDSARAWRTYTGGAMIDRINGTGDGTDSHFPEDWIMSTVRAINAGREDVAEGLNTIHGTNTTLRDAIASDPATMLGTAHAARWGKSPAVLVKLIDAAERLGVQCHPDKEKARTFFDSPFGKTECWHIVGGREIDGERPCVYMGFKPGVTAAAWRDVFDRQDIPAMLDMLHRIEVKPGDTFLIEGGLPHAIGAGCLLIEIQEPTDYTFRTERVTVQGLAVPERACHYGIGFDNMFSCFHYDGCDEAEARRRHMVAPMVVARTDDFVHAVIVGPPRTDYFSLERLDVTGRCRVAASGEFSGMYVLSGSGRMESAAERETLKPGDQFFVPAASNDFTLAADADAPLAVFVAKAPGGSFCRCGVQNAATELM